MLGISGGRGLSARSLVTAIGTAALLVTACDASPTPTASGPSGVAATSSPVLPAAPSAGAPSMPTTSPSPAPGGTGAGSITGTFALPFPPGIIATPGSLGLHADNFGYLDDRSTSTPTGDGYTLTAADGASLDLLAAGGTNVLPLAPGTVLAISPYCQAALVDHGGGTWVEYVHLDPDASIEAGQAVTRTTPLGTVAAALPGPDHTGNCGLVSDAPHVHLAFLVGDPGARTGSYVPMAGLRLCGHAVTAAGGIAGLSTGPGVAFTVPACPGDTAAPSPVLAASWSAPDAGAKLATTKVRLAARASFTLASTTVRKVTFAAEWGSTTRAVCTATKPRDNVWSCSVDLWDLGVVAGKATFSFDVIDSAGTVTRSPAGTRSVRLPDTALADVKVPVIPCPTMDAAEGSIRYVKPRGLPASQPMAIPIGIADAAVLYGTGEHRLLGPRGWTCEATFGVDGSGQVAIVNPPDHTMRIYLEPVPLNDTSANWYACAYFPAARKAEADLGIDCPDPAPPTAEQVTGRSRTVVLLLDPAHVKGSLSGSGGRHPAIGGIWYAGRSDPAASIVSCVMPPDRRAWCSAVESDWQRRL